MYDFILNKIRASKYQTVLNWRSITLWVFRTARRTPSFESQIFDRTFLLMH